MRGSTAYARTVIFGAVFRLSRPEIDDHAIDGTILDPDRRGVNRVDFQIKATTQYRIANGVVVYDLRVEDYNRLIIEDDAPRILILYIMPNDAHTWLAPSDDELWLRNLFSQLR